MGSSIIAHQIVATNIFERETEKDRGTGGAAFQQYSVTMVTISLDQKYLVPFGLMKGVEFITILIGWAIFADWTAGWWAVHARIQYFIAIGVISWLFVIIWFLLNILKITDKITVSPKNMVFAVIHFVFGVLLLIGAGVVSTWGRYYSNVTAGIAFGYIGSIVLLFDGVLHIVLGKNLYGGVTVSTTVTKTTTTVTTS